MSDITYKTGVVLVLFAGLLWSGVGTGIRLIENANTWQILFYRSLGMVPVLFGYLAIRTGGHPLQSIQKAGRAGVVGGFCLVLAFAGSIFAFQATTIANAAFLFAAAPLFTAILAWIILRETVRTATWFALILALFGIGMMVREGLAFGALAGNIAALISAFGFAGFALSLRWGRMANMLPAVILGGAMALICAGIMTLLQGGGLMIPLKDVAIAMAIGALLVGGGMVAFTIGSRVLSAVDLTLLSMVEVMLAPLWGWIILREEVGMNTLIGGAILFTALLLNALTGVRHRPPKVI